MQQKGEALRLKHYKITKKIDCFVAQIQHRQENVCRVEQTSMEYGYQMVITCSS